MPFAIRLSGPLDIALLKRSLQIVVAHQEVLLCHLTGKLISHNLVGKAVRGLMRLSLGSAQVWQKTFDDIETQSHNCDLLDAK